MIAPIITAGSEAKEKIEKIPRTANTQRTNKTPAISLNGLGRNPRSPANTKNISTSHKVIVRPLMIKREIFGITNPGIWTYPNSQRIIRTARIAIIIKLIYYLRLKAD